MTATKSKKALRQSQLLHVLEQLGYAGIGELSERLAVSEQTVRRDIFELDRQGKLRRKHGGAAISASIDGSVYFQRRLNQTDAKKRIANKVVGLIEDDMSIFLDAGTTCEAISEALGVRKNLKVVTYSLRSAINLKDRTDFTVAIPGGFVRHIDGSVIGGPTSNFIEGFRFDVAIISVSGIDETGEMGDDDQMEVTNVKTAMERAKTVILATDATKFCKTALVHLGSVREVSHLVTDEKPGGSLAKIIAESGVEVHIA